MSSDRVLLSTLIRLHGNEAKELGYPPGAGRETHMISVN